MADFNLKKWLDDRVVPLLVRELRIYSFFWNGSPPKDVCVFLVAGPSEKEPEQPLDKSAWPEATHELIQRGFRFDALREPQVVHQNDQKFALFGGDGAPLINEDRVASARLLRREDDGINLILNVVCRYASATDAAQAVKQFFALFGKDPFTVLEEFGTRFGAA